MKLVPVNPDALKLILEAAIEFQEYREKELKTSELDRNERTETQAAITRCEQAIAEIEKSTFLT